MDAYHTSFHRIAMEIGRWLNIPISRDNISCHFCSYNVVEIEPHFVLRYPLYNPIRDKFHSLFENVILGSLKSFFQLNHQVDISLYLTEATSLCHSRDLVGLTTSRCTLSPCSLLAFQTLVSIPFHYNSLESLGIKLSKILALKDHGQRVSINFQN